MRHRPWVLLLLAAPLACLASSPTAPASAFLTTPHHMDSTGEVTTIERDHETRPELSRRALSTESAHIEAVLSRYADLRPKPANLAQGVAHWEPPPSALRQMETGLKLSANHKYGPALGDSGLRDALVKKLEIENGLDMNEQEVHAISMIRTPKHHNPGWQRPWLHSRGRKIPSSRLNFRNPDSHLPSGRYVYVHSSVWSIFQLPRSCRRPIGARCFASL